MVLPAGLKVSDDVSLAHLLAELFEASEIELINIEPTGQPISVIAASDQIHTGAADDLSRPIWPLIMSLPSPAFRSALPIGPD
jgi:hypothetical protein